MSPDPVLLDELVRRTVETVQPRGMALFGEDADQLNIDAVQSRYPGVVAPFPRRRLPACYKCARHRRLRVYLFAFVLLDSIFVKRSGDFV